MSKQKTLQAFIDVQNGIRSESSGICWNASKNYTTDERNTEMCTIVRIIGAKWHNTTGNANYPVDYNPACIRKESLYDQQTTTGQRRIELLEFIISELQLSDYEFSKKYYISFHMNKDTTPFKVQHRLTILWRNLWNITK